MGLSYTAYYYTRGLLSEEELHGGQFIPIMSRFGLIQVASMPVGRSRRQQASVQTKLMAIEVRTSSGTKVRLTGSFSAEMGKDPLDGSVYVFINARRDRIKLLHMEPGGLLLFIKVLERGELNTGKRTIDYSGT